MSDTGETEPPGDRRSGHWYRKLVEESTDVTAVVGVDGTVTYVSPAVERLLGYDPADLTGDSGCEYVHSDDCEALSETIEALRAAPTDPQTVEFRCQRADGTWCWIEATMRDRLGDDVDGIVVNARDVTERKEREQELRTTRERMKLGLEGANLGIWDWDMETDELARDELLTEMLGYTQSGMGDRLEDWEEVVHPAGKARHDEALAEHVENGTPYYQCEYRLETKSGDWKWVRTIGKVVERDQTGEPIRAVGIHQDIDDRKRAELALEAERDMFKEGPAVVFKWEDVEGWPVTYVSENVESVFGYSPDELVSNEIDYADLVHDDDLERVEQGKAADDDTGSDLFSPDPYRVHTADGDIRWVMEYTKDLQEDGENNHLLGYIVDITERKRRELELQQFKAAVDQSAHAIYMTDTDGTIEYVNPAFETITGYTEAAAVGATPRLLQSGEYSEAFYEDFWETILDGDRWEAEILDERADGEEMFLNQTVAPITDDDGEIRKFVAVARDVTERKQYEEALEDAREELRQVIDLIPDLVFATDREGAYLLANETTAEALGTTPGELEGASASEIDAPQELFDGFREDDLAVIDSGETRVIAEENVTTADGDERIVQTTKIPFETAKTGEDAVLSYARDVTELKERERELRAREEKYRNLFEDTRDALMLLDRDGFFDCNERALDLFEIESVDAFVEYTPWELSPPTQPDGRDSKRAALDHVETAFEDGAAFFEWTHQRPDGTDFPAEVKLSRFEHRGEPALHALVRDITERKEYERRIEEQRDNLDVLNQVLRHDIRNDIQLITAYAEMLARESDDAELQAYIETVLENANHAVELTTSAREMANVMLSAEEGLEQVDLRTVLETEIEEVQAAHPEAGVTWETPIPPVSVQANDMLGSVFRNLLKNAIQHTDAAVPAVVVSAADRADVAVVRVADNGPGVPDDQKDTIFGQGEKGLDSQGTGIGLYLVKTLVESYGGDIWVEDRTGGDRPDGRPQASERAERSSPGDRSETGDRTERGGTDSQATPGDDAEGAVFVVELPKAEPA